MFVGEAVIECKIVRADENGIATVTEIAEMVGALQWKLLLLSRGEPYTGWVEPVIFTLNKGCHARSLFYYR